MQTGQKLAAGRRGKGQIVISVTAFTCHCRLGGFSVLRTDHSRRHRGNRLLLIAHGDLPLRILMGAKKKPFYRIVVADSHSPRDGRGIEEIGTYDPLTNPGTVKVDVEKAQAWIKNGAQPTDTVKALLKKANVL